MIRLAILILRPYEKVWAWHIRRQYRLGKFRRPYGDPHELGSTGAVTTRKEAA